MGKKDDEETKEEHESFGMVGFYRTTGNPGRLFGSPLRTHEAFVTLRVSKGARYNDYGQDRYHGGMRGEILELILSEGQFASLLTSMNVGTGVPCTLRYIMGKELPKPPEEIELEVDKVRQHFHKDMKKVVAGVKEAKKEMAELLEKKSLSKADRERIMNVISRVEMHIESNAPFMVQQFEEAAEKVVVHSKAEIDAFLTNNAFTEGMKVLQERAVASGQKTIGAQMESPQLPPAEANDGD